MKARCVETLCYLNVVLAPVSTAKSMIHRCIMPGAKGLSIVELHVEHTPYGGK